MPKYMIFKQDNLSETERKQLRQVVDRPVRGDTADDALKKAWTDFSDEDKAVDKYHVIDTSGMVVSRVQQKPDVTSESYEDSIPQEDEAAPEEDPEG
jgi:hypothetical protein